MVLAIALSGLILAAALLPLTQIMVAYQDAELDGQTMQAQRAAVTRAEQIGNSIWRDPNAPAGHAGLQTAIVTQLQVGDWQFRGSGTRIEQQRLAEGWATIAQPVQSFGFQYVLSDGTCTAAPDAGELAEVIAVKVGWSDSASGLQYAGTSIPPDSSFMAGLVELDRPGTGTPYHRSDYERHVTLTLGSWP
jgi:hypothetical protein